MLTLREWANLDTAKSRKKFQDFLTLKTQPYSDVLSVAEAGRLYRLSPQHPDELVP